MNATSQNKSFMSRLAHFGNDQDSVGKVNVNECHHLADTLKMIGQGGSTFLPVACSSLLKHEEDIMKERFERENAKVYERLKRRTSWIGKQDYPPSST